MRVGPPRWAIGRKVVALARAPQRPEDRGSASDKAARRGNRARLVKNLRGVGVKGEPPAEQAPGQVDRPAECKEPRWAKPVLIGQFGCIALRVQPQTRQKYRKRVVQGKSVSVKFHQAGTRTT